MIAAWKGVPAQIARFLARVPLGLPRFRTNAVVEYRIKTYVKLGHERPRTLRAH